VVLRLIPDYGVWGSNPQPAMMMKFDDVTFLDFVVQARDWSNMSTWGRRCHKVEVVAIGTLLL